MTTMLGGAIRYLNTKLGGGGEATMGKTQLIDKGA